MKDKEFLKKLLESQSPSGYETETLSVFSEYCSEFSNLEFIDSMGNTCFSIGTENSCEKTIMISAHIDELGFQITYINDNGLLNFERLGGVDVKTLFGTRVKLIGNNGEKIMGVIGKKPIHVEDHEDMRGYPIEQKELTIDIGVESKEEALKFVSIGTVGTYADDPIMNFGENRICSRGLDDKIGIYICACVLKKLETSNFCKNNKNYKIYCVANTQEECGLRGALVTSKRINPDISIDVDVTFSTCDNRGVEKEIYGELTLGKGPVIAIGPSINNNLVNLAKKVMEKENINVQYEVVYPGGTNTSAIQENSIDCKTSLISVPIRSMHTQAEVCDMRDVNGAIDLIYSMIVNME